MTSQHEVQQQIKDRTPVDPALYELSVEECRSNSEPLTGGRSTIPANRGYEIRMTITNRDDRTRQFEIRFAVSDSEDASQVEEGPVNNTHRLAPGESQTIERKGWLAYEHVNGISCQAEVWPSMIEILDPPPNS